MGKKNPVPLSSQEVSSMLDLNNTQLNLTSTIASKFEVGQIVKVKIRNVVANQASADLSDIKGMIMKIMPKEGQCLVNIEMLGKSNSIKLSLYDIESETN